MINIAICDDDTAFLDLFESLLSKSFSRKGQAVAISKFDNGTALLDSIEKDKQYYQVVFLDVEMPGINGFQLAARLKEINTGFLLLFTTFMEHQSREGYRYGAFRYIFKNNLDAEIDEAVTSILTKLAHSSDGGEELTFKYRNDGVLDDISIRKEDILFLRREKNRRVIIKTVTSEYELLTKPLSDYGGMLQSSCFYPVMRNYIVNFNHVQSLDADSFILTDGSEIPLGVKREVKLASKNKYLQFLQEQL